MSLRRLLAGFALLVLSIAQARGHDTGFGHSRRTLSFWAGPEEFLLDYRIVLGADEALVEMTRMDQDGDGRISSEEKDRYFALRAAELSRGWQVTTAEGNPLRPVFRRVELGHSLTQTYRFSIPTVERTIVFGDTNFTHKPGQVAILAGPGLQAAPQTPSDLSHAERISVLVTRKNK